MLETLLWHVSGTSMRAFQCDGLMEWASIVKSHKDSAMHNKPSVCLHNTVHALVSTAQVPKYGVHEGPVVLGHDMCGVDVWESRHTWTSATHRSHTSTRTGMLTGRLAS